MAFIVDLSHAQHVLKVAEDRLKNGNLGQQERAKFWKALAENYIKRYEPKQEKRSNAEIL